MDSRLRNFTSMNPSMYYGSKANEDPQDFLDEVYKFLFSMGVTSGEMSNWHPINSKIWRELGHPMEE